MTIDPHYLAGLFGEEPTVRVAPNNQPAPSKKRGRGRPRKPHPLDQLGDPNEFSPPPGLDPNITAETRQDFERIREEHRRSQVSDSVRDAYRAGRNTANKVRQTAKNRDLRKIMGKNIAVVANPTMSASAKARWIVANGTNFGRGERAIAAKISEALKACKAK